MRESFITFNFFTNLHLMPAHYTFTLPQVNIRSTRPVRGHFALCGVTEMIRLVLNLAELVT